MGGGRPAGAVALFVLLLAGFVGGGLYSGWRFVRTVEAYLQASQLEGQTSIVKLINPVTIAGQIAKPTATVGAGTAAPGATPVPSNAPAIAPDEPLPSWNGKDRVNILLLGIDQRDDEKGLPTRSDTMIIISIDPVNKTGAMLSIPRDLYVPILTATGKMRDENKINTAHFFGELDKPGSGPEAARRTIQYNFGVPIHYVARVDFHGFEQMINQLNGITIDVDRAILDDEYPNEKYGISRLYIPAGPQHMDGITALRYARSRHADSDFGRVRRQQKVLEAARDEALQANLVTATKLPGLVPIVMSSVYTDIPVIDMFRLANLGRQIPSAAIEKAVIDDTMIVDQYGDGTYLIPQRDRIRELVNELFYDPALKAENARIEVLNGTTKDGLATNTGTLLKGLGLNVVRIDGASRADYRQTLIVDHRGDKKVTTQKLAQELHVPKTAITTDSTTSPQADVTVILGADYRPS